MILRRLFLPLFLVVPIGFAQDVVLHGYQTGGAGGAVALGSGTDSTNAILGIGGSAGGLVELDDATIARLGFWGAASPSFTVSTPPRAVPSASLRARTSDSRLIVDFRNLEATDASIRIVGIDGRTVLPIWTGHLAEGTSQKSLSLAGLEGQALFVLVEAGALRKVWQFHPVSR